MADLQNNIRVYKHFLKYNQLCELDIEYGLTDLFYYINESTLFIKEINHRNKSEVEFDFPIQDNRANLISILESFLIDFMSQTSNFAGTPTYESSDLFSKEAFEKMLEKSINLINERYDSAIILNSESEIIKYCKSVHLNPEPQGSSPTSWIANCPSGGSHHITISTKSNEWGCGYCQKKGDLSELRVWYNCVR